MEALWLARRVFKRESWVVAEVARFFFSNTVRSQRSAFCGVCRHWPALHPAQRTRKYRRRAKDAKDAKALLTPELSERTIWYRISNLVCGPSEILCIPNGWLCHAFCEFLFVRWCVWVLLLSLLLFFLVFCDVCGVCILYVFFWKVDEEDSLAEWLRR